MSASVHAASRLCLATVAAAMRHLGTPQGMARWSLGMWDCREVEPGLLTGKSLFDGSIAWARIVELAGVDAIDYHVGASPDQLLPRIHARVIDGPLLGHPSGTCIVSLVAWQPEGMPEERWRRLVVSHETEIELIQAQLGADPR